VALQLFDQGQAVHRRLSGVVEDVYLDETQEEFVQHYCAPISFGDIVSRDNYSGNRATRYPAGR
jgi:hypothetical protein